MNTLNSFLLLFSIVTLYGCGAGSRPIEPLRTGFTSAIVISGDTLFTLDSNNVEIFDISDEALPEQQAEIAVAGKNSILVHQDHLYVIDKNGSSIWDVHDPSSPVVVGTDKDLRGCGQTVAEDLTGYSALQWNRSCDDILYLIEIVDFADPGNPEKIAEYSLSGSASLIKTPHFLVVCGRYQGLALLDMDSPQHVQEIVQIPAHDCTDAAVGPDTLIFRDWDGIYQFEFVDTEPKQISRIPTGPP